MELGHLSSFYQVVLRGSFSAAADALGVSKGMLSRHVSALERDLNAQLLQRTTRRLSLTEAGKSLYQQAGEIFALAQQARQDIEALTEEDSGRLRFTCPVSMGDRLAAELLEHFAALCPGVSLEFNFTNAALDMSQGEHDIALRAMTQIPDNLVALPLGRLRDVVVASPAWVARHGLPATPYEMAAHSCLLQDHNPAWEQWHLAREGEEARILVQGKVRSNHYSTLLRLAVAGMGPTKCPLMLADPLLARGELQWLLPAWQGSLHPLHIVHAQQRRVPRKIKLFKQLLQAWFREHPHYLM
ncbi:LysR family transcriptional regulator [Aeromonas bivalvium]|uniref:LysR family transcriptional regulator n=1 Tax=Aeromonas bivalvium TaxID=440079 RepID=UPI0005A84F6B|nr:LysR family transcriptional regulator [Aeromonas bivalvium]